MEIVISIIKFLALSFWLMFVISIGVNAGLKTFYKTTFRKKED